MINPICKSHPVRAGFLLSQARKTGDAATFRENLSVRYPTQALPLGQLDLNINPSRQIELHQRVNGLRGGLHDIEQPLIRAHFELLTQLFVDVGSAVDAEFFNPRRQWNGAPDQSAGALCCICDVTCGLIEHAMVERLQANANILGFHVHLPMRKSKTK
jgi:hypothetical protein